MVHVLRAKNIPGNGLILFDRQDGIPVWWIHEDLVTVDGARWLEAMLNLLMATYRRQLALVG